ncbi:hypothetical protein Rcae01_06625 [Novipirellula caenicola]|uniref:Uncharacterized protein n=1 Tax=Novipirellula caenicola TaxID=1536901 RepID=A0ABP9W152_9BACT
MGKKNEGTQHAVLKIFLSQQSFCPTSAITRRALLHSFTPHSSLLTPHSPLLTPHSSLLTPHSSLLTSSLLHSSLLTPHSSLLTPHSSLLTPCLPVSLSPCLPALPHDVVIKSSTAPIMHTDSTTQLLRCQNDLDHGDRGVNFGFKLDDAEVSTAPVCSPAMIGATSCLTIGMQAREMPRGDSYTLR